MWLITGTSTEILQTSMCLEYGVAIPGNRGYPTTLLNFQSETVGAAVPFKAKAQQRLFFANEERGELPVGTAELWAKHTPDIKSLPEHVKKKAAKGVSKLKTKLNRRKHK